MWRIVSSTCRLFAFFPVVSYGIRVADQLWGCKLELFRQLDDIYLFSFHTVLNAFQNLINYTLMVPVVLVVSEPVVDPVLSGLVPGDFNDPVVVLFS